MEYTGEIHATSRMMKKQIVVHMPSKIIKEASIGGSVEQVITMFPNEHYDINFKWGNLVRDSVYVLKLMKYDVSSTNVTDYRYRVLAGWYDHETWRNRPTKKLKPSLELFESYSL